MESNNGRQSNIDRIAELALAAGVIILGAIVLWQTRHIRITPINSRIGPRVIPYVVGSGLVVVGIWLAIEVMMAPDRAAGRRRRGQRGCRPYLADGLGDDRFHRGIAHRLPGPDRAGRLYHRQCRPLFRVGIWHGEPADRAGHRDRDRDGNRDLPDLHAGTVATPPPGHPPARVRRGTNLDGRARGSGARVQRRADAAEPALGLRRRHARHRGRRAARHRPALTVALLLPVTVNLDPTGALIMFAGIYYGAMYGGSTTSILLNTPGEIGHDRDGDRRQPDGQARPRRRRRWPPPRSARSSPARIATIGADVVRAGRGRARAQVRSGGILRADGPRLHHRSAVLGDFAAARPGQPVHRSRARPRRHRQLRPARRASPSACPSCSTASTWSIVAVGLFAVGETLYVASYRSRDGTRPDRAAARLDLDDAARTGGVRGSRGCAARRSAFRSARFPPAARRSRPSSPMRSKSGSAKHPEEFGHGAIEGVAGPEAANNASAAGALVPLLTLGLPTSATAAILLAAFQHYGLQPGPLLFADAAGPGLGSDRQPLHRQRDAADPQPAAGRPLGEAARDSAAAALCRHPGLRHARRL